MNTLLNLEITEARRHDMERTAQFRHRHEWPDDGLPPRTAEEDRGPFTRRPSSRGSLLALEREAAATSPDRLDRSRRAVRTATLAQPLDRLAVRQLDAASASLGPRREHDPGDFEPCRSHRLDREQGVVDRPEARRASDDDRQPAVEREVPHQVVGAQAERGTRRRPRTRGTRQPHGRRRRPSRSRPTSIGSPAISAAR